MLNLRKSVKKFFTIILTALVFITPGIAIAGVKFSVELTSIEKIQASEQHGDELYFAITEYSSHGDATHTRVPSYPQRWLSKELEMVKDANLWEAVLESGESLEVILSLIEMDVAPWNVDDLVGTVKLRIQNKDGIIRSDWINNKRQVKAFGAMNKISKEFHLKRDDAIYKVILTLKPLKY